MPWWVPQIHAHASLVLGTGIYALLHLQSWADAQLPRSEAGSAGAMALLAASWLACTWLCFLLVKTTLLVPIMVRGY